jgi:6-phosphogluconolactonase
MNIEVLSDPAAVAQRAAPILADEAQAAIAGRGTFVMAVSGGQTPWQMLRDLATLGIPWQAVHIVQVDERVAPEGHADRNLTHLRESLLDHAPLSPEQIYAMPVEDIDLETAAAHYAEILRKIAGDPPVLDLVHLGLSADGHTASLCPMIQCCAQRTWMSPYQGRRRMTLTLPALNRARRILWGDWKREGGNVPAFARRLLFPLLVGIRRLRARKIQISAGRIRRDEALVLADGAAAAETHSLIKGEVVCAWESLPITADSC